MASSGKKEPEGNQGAVRPPAAVAMRYDKGRDAAPRVVAVGRGAVAEAILRVAEEQEIPVWHDDRLANALARVELGALIPPEMYQAVAEVLAFLWRLEATREERR